MATESDAENDNRILTAVQLGWLGVEAFGLLRRYSRFGRTPSASKADANRRFNFTERDLNINEQLLVSLQRLKATAARLTPDLPPPVPDDLSVLLKEAKKDIDPVWERFEDWSRQAWNTLLVSDPQAGQAFAWGGDLADTYWYAQGAGADKLDELLRSHRLEYIAERIGDVADALPEHAAQAIQHSLGAWSIGESVKGRDIEDQKRLLERLEAQIKVWRDLLFGLRGANSYLTPDHQRRIARRAVMETAGLVVGVGVGVWLAVLVLASLGRSLLGSTMSMPFIDTTKITSDVTAYLSNWQNWSSLLAVASSVVVTLTGLTGRLSGWLWAFHAKRKQALTLQCINQRTYRDDNP